MNLPAVLIKEAVDKGDWVRVKKLGAAYCEDCGHCSYVCPARIDLRTIVPNARDRLKEMSASAL